MKTSRLVRRNNPDSLMMTVKEAAELLGCSYKTITNRRVGCFSLIRLNDLPNSPIRLLRAEVEAFISERIEAAQKERDRLLNDFGRF